MDIAEYKRLYAGKDYAAPGWDAIDARLIAVYGDQEPRHWGTAVEQMMGGPDPLDGISAYQCHDGGMPHLHFCTYGYTSLYYDEESAGGEFSRFGFEMTFRLSTSLPPSAEPYWVLNLLNNISRYIFKTGRWFEPFHWLDAKGPICAVYPTDLVGLAFLPDPALSPIETPHGRVEFLQAFGITATELDGIKNGALTCDQVIDTHSVRNPLLITDLNRRDEQA